ncbi:hypothetical protein ES705_45534 [subsurface metagenome]
MRWVVPPTMGAAMPAGLMLRNRMANGFITEDQVFRLSREGLAKSGLAVANITSRAVEPLPGSWAGVIVRFDGEKPFDRTPEDDPSTNPLYPGVPTYNFYSIEVVQRIGYDSFCPDNGVLLAKNKDREGRNGGPNQFNCFNWVIDAHPEDINMVDYIKPDGTLVMRTIADYRQLNDALFHAGLNSGSEFEYVDTSNRLHFYILDIQKNDNGILSYTVAARSLDGQGLQKRGVAVTPPEKINSWKQKGYCDFTVTNQGTSGKIEPGIHPQDVSKNIDYDIYRLKVVVEGAGWDAQLLNEIACIKNGGTLSVPVYISKTEGKAGNARVTLIATSESDPSKSSFAILTVK